jgi:epoxyqueuosine reductase
MKKSSVLDNTLLKELGVLDWGYTEDPIPHTLNHYEQWTEDSLHGPLNYLADHRKDLRKDLRLVFPEFQSALVFLFSYQESKKWMLDNNEHSVAAYTLGFEGEDYHRALKTRLTQISDSLNMPGTLFFQTIDAQPVLERDLAYRAGLGWFGKNSMLIHQKEGSYFIIGSLLLDKRLAVESGKIDIDHCGQCKACIDACPTAAINIETRTIEASKCISTFTIEIFKDAQAPEGFDNSRGEIFGCDICQDVCPWNRKPLARVIGQLKLKESFTYIKEWLFEWPKEKLKDFIESESNRGFKKKFFGTPFDRPGKEGWLKNLKSKPSQNVPSKKKKGEE